MEEEEVSFAAALGLGLVVEEVVPFAAALVLAVAGLVVAEEVSFAVPEQHLLLVAAAAVVVAAVEDRFCQTVNGVLSFGFGLVVVEEVEHKQCHGE